ncbi:hypothetical protein C2G38_2213330 [Gigaspora rosea]|uniref:Uncharacterized protein n=1 Tax=Gigaspora rosea TaxID=44941 RepID=A0A397UDV8_9GLOM|nr:hypothetical protein C2G38_2213330 [Gigaspora rosea]
MLDIFNKDLEGPLDLRDFVNLKELYCYNINLVSSDISNSPELKKLYCYKNQHTSLDLNGIKLHTYASLNIRSLET